MNREVRQKQPRLISKKITDSAKGEQCTLRIPGVCNFNPETTVFAHMNGGGMAYKHHDIHGCYGCNCCHDFIDGRGGCTHDDKINYSHEILRAMIETQSKLLDKGLIKI